MAELKTVLLLGEYGVLNGGENSLLAIIPQLQQRGWRFVAAVEPDSEFESALSCAGITNQGFSFSRSQIGSPIGSKSAVVRKTQAEIRAELVEVVRKVRPDLIHCNSLSTSRLCGPVARECNVPALGYLRDIVKLSRKAVGDINLLDRIIAVSHATRQFHIEHGMDAKKIHVVHNGIGTSAPAAQLGPDEPQGTVRNEFGMPSDAMILLSVGQISMRKGLDALIDAFAIVVAQQTSRIHDSKGSALHCARPVHLLIVGQRYATKDEAVEFEQSLWSSAATINRQFGKRVHFAGRREDVPALMRESDILVHAARQEPLGRVLLEASAAGLPVVATNVGGTAEILRDNGRFNPLVPPDDPAALAEKVLTLLSDNCPSDNGPSDDGWNDDGLRAATGHFNRQTVEENFPVRKCADAIHEHYLNLLQIPANNTPTG